MYVSDSPQHSRISTIGGGLDGILDGALDVRMRSLERANEVRGAAADLRREVIFGVTSFRDALLDPRAGTITAYRLLLAVPRVGPARARRVLRDAGVRAYQTCRELTPRQRGDLIELTRGKIQWPA